MFYLKLSAPVAETVVVAGNLLAMNVVAVVWTDAACIQALLKSVSSTNDSGR